jgi:Zn/Cd-binding protein ZinT
MIQLNKLSKIASGKAERDEQERLEREREYNEKQEKQYQEVIENLEQRLKNAALDGKNQLEVAHFSAFTGGNISDRLHKKRGSYGNYYVAWNKAIFESDVIENMQGNLKRVYDYLQSNNLNPIVNYWTDGGGMDEGFELVVEW